MITSTGNARIRELVKLKKNAKERAKQGVFLVEGPKMFREIPPQLCLEVYAAESFIRTEEGAALKLGGCNARSAGDSPVKPDSVVLSKPGSAAAETAAMTSGANGIRMEVVSDAVFQYLSDTKNPQGILAVVKQLKYELQDLTGRKAQTIQGAQTAQIAQGGKTPQAAQIAPLMIVLENLQDPGNLGTILRTAEAAGATGILLSQGCADIYSPKVTRSTMGSIFRVPFVYTDHLKEDILLLQGQGVRFLAAHLKGSVDLYEADCSGSVAFLIGNESRGLTDEIAELADLAVRIPMSGSVESLNAAVASAVLMFEAKRQRRG